MSKNLNQAQSPKRTRDLGYVKLPMPDFSPEATRPSSHFLIENVYGACVYRFKDGELQVLVTCQNNGTSGFPKTHPKGNETRLATAARCVKKETGLDVVIDTAHSYGFMYAIHERKVNKQVIYHLAQPINPEQELACGDSELCDLRWIPASEVENYCYYEEYKLAARMLINLIMLLNQDKIKIACHPLAQSPSFQPQTKI